MAKNTNGKVGLPSCKLSFNPSSNGKNTTKPIDKFLYEACEERYGVDPDIDKSRASEDIYESQYGFKSAEEVLEFCQKRIDEISAQGKKVRNDCIPLCNTILKPNILLMQKFPTKAEQKKFLDDIVEEAKYQIGLKALVVEDRDADTITKEEAIKRGKELMVIACYHFDEGNPHVHLFWEPLERRDGKLVFNAKKMHDKTLLSSLHRFIPKGLIEKGYQLDKSFSFVEATKEEKDEYIKNKRLGNVQNGRDSILYKVQQAQEIDLRIEQNQEFLEHQEEMLTEIKEKEDDLKKQTEAFEQEQQQLIQMPVPENDTKVKKASMFDKTEMIELPKEQYDETMSQLKALKRADDKKDTVIKEKTEQVESLTAEVERLRPFEAFVLNIITWFADRRYEPETRDVLIEGEIKHSFSSLFQKAKEKAEQAIKKTPVWSISQKQKNPTKSRDRDTIER